MWSQKKKLKNYHNLPHLHWFQGAQNRCVKKTLTLPTFVNLKIIKL